MSELYFIIEMAKPDEKIISEITSKFAVNLVTGTNVHNSQQKVI